MASYVFVPDEMSSLMKTQKMLHVEATTPDTIATFQVRIEPCNFSAPNALFMFYQLKYKLM
jgi:hypothetical protein